VLAEAAADVQDEEGPEVLDAAAAPEAAADVQDEEGPEGLDAAAAPEAAADVQDEGPDVLAEAAADVQDEEGPEVLDAAAAPEAAAGLETANATDELGAPDVLEEVEAGSFATAEVIVSADSFDVAGATDDEPGTAVGCGAAGAAAEDDDAAVAAPGVDSTSRPVTSNVSLRYAALTSSKKLPQPRYTMWFCT
jgi:hypothetical protein